ncbi:hypothetical protein [Alienimonas sp. DA493]|uniref:hypothetical protein n=1 Tax=Alienimonas sp. DA493 TaxID=3373605 RepID=UPI0037549586
MAPLLITLGLVTLCGAAAWIYGETAALRWVRTLGAFALLGVVGIGGAIAGSVDQWFRLNFEYAERLEAFRAAAEKRLEAGECDRVRAELRLLNGQLTYESGLTLRKLEESTTRLTAPRKASADAPQGADAPRSPE